MAGTMRKMGVYLGLLEDGDADYYDDPSYDPSRDAGYGEPRRASGSTREPSRPLRTSDLGVEESREVARLDDHRRGSGQPSGATAMPPAQRAAAPAPSAAVASLSRITTLHPRTYNEARVIGENFRDGVPVIMNLSEMSDGDAKRLVDFAAGLVFATRGTIERVTNKVFLLSPPNVSVAAEDKQRIAESGFFNQS